MGRVFWNHLSPSAKWGARFPRKIAYVQKIAKSDFSEKCHFRGILRIFWPPFLEALFFLGALLARRTNVEEVDTRETLRNKGFRTDFASFFLFDPSICLKKPRFCGPSSTIIFPACYYFLFSEVRFLTKLGFEVQNALGLQSRGRFQKRLFCIVSGARARKFDAMGARARQFFCRVWCRWQKWPCRCGAEGFRVFFGFCLATPFSQTSSGPLHTPLFLFRCFSLLFAFFLGLEATAHCTCVFGQLAFDLPFFCFLGSFLQKHCFSPWRRVILVHFSVSPFRSPWLLPLLFITLSLSLYLFFFLVFFLSLSCCLVFIFTFLVVWRPFLLCLFAFVSCKEQHQNITFASFIFINYFCVFVFHKYVLIFVFSLLKSYVLVHINVFQVFQEDHFYHPIWFCTLWKVMVFFGNHLGGNFGGCSRATVKIGISAHC